MSPRLAPFVAAPVAGLLFACGAFSVGPSWAWWTAALALAPLAWVIDTAQLSPLRAAIAGWLAGCTALAVGLYWIAPTLEAFMVLSLPLAWLLAGLFFAWHGGQWALFAALLSCARRGGWSVAWVLVPCWLASELVWPTLFPCWLGLAIHTRPAAMQLADLGGVPLLSALLALTNAAVYVALRGMRRGERSPVVAAVFAWALCLGYGHYRIGEVRARMERAPQLRVGIVQANVSPTERLASPRQSLIQHLQLSREAERAGAPIDLLVWPETAMLGVEHARDFGKKVRTPLLYGGVEQQGARRFNTAFFHAGLDAPDYRYRKQRLLVVGEHVPWVDQLPALAGFFPNTTEFTPGRSLAPATLAGHRLSPLICYEDVLPDYVREVVRRARPELLVALSNDAWFGDTTEPAMHHALSRFRAVEHHLYLVRATQTGVSGVIDPLGESVVQSEVGQPAALTAQVAWLSPSGLFVQLGPWPHWLGLILSVVLMLPRPRLRD